MTRPLESLPQMLIDAPDRRSPRPIDHLVVGPPGDGDLIEDLARVVANECEADDILVAIHGPDRDPAPLFFTGCHAADGSVERSMLAAADAVSAGDVDGTPAWRTIALADRRTVGVMTTSIAGGGQRRITVTALFGTIGDATRSRARKMSARLAPLVSAFFRLWQLRSRAVDQMRGLAAAVNHSDVGVVIVDRAATILFANAAAQALLDQREAVRANASKLVAGRLADTLRMQAAIAHVAAAEDGAEAPHDAPVLALPRPGRRPLMAALVGGDSRGDGSVVVHLFDPEVDFGALVEPVCKFYGLSPVETRLARLLAAGISLAEAAEAMRVREQSARSYLKQIFMKTETRRQGELVWLLLRSSVRTAPDFQTSFISPLKWG